MTRLTRSYLASRRRKIPGRVLATIRERLPHARYEEEFTAWSEARPVSIQEQRTEPGVSFQQHELVFWTAELLRGDPVETYVIKETDAVGWRDPALGQVWMRVETVSVELQGQRIRCRGVPTTEPQPLATLKMALRRETTVRLIRAGVARIYRHTPN